MSLCVPLTSCYPVPMNNHTVTEVLSIHGIDVPAHAEAYFTNMLGYSPREAARAATADAARAHGVIRACLGCGSIVGCATDGLDELTLEVERRAARDAIDWDDPMSDCCPDADSILF